MKKRLLSILLGLSILLFLVPTEVLAVGSSTGLQEPTVTRFTVTYRDGDLEQTISLLPLDSNLEPITMVADSPLTFCVDFSSLERLDKVYITSTTTDGTKYLEAVYDKMSGTYIASGYFAPDDTDYVPGMIGISYTKKVVAVTEETTISPDIDLYALKTSLNDEGISLSRLQESDDGNSVQAQVILGAMGSGTAEVYVDAAISTFVDDIGGDRSELEKWLGVYKNLGALASSQLKGSDGKEYTLYLDDGEIGDTDTWLLLVKDVTGNKYTKMLISKAAGSIGLGDITGNLEQANTVSKMLLNYTSISSDMNALRQDVDASTMTASQKSEAHAKIAALEQDKKLFMMGTTLLPLFVGATVITGGTALSVAPALLFSSLMGGITSASSYFWENRIGMIHGCDPVEGVFSGEKKHDGSWIPLTNDALHENNWCINQSGHYHLVEDVSLINITNVNDEHPVPLDVTICLHGHNIKFGIYASNQEQVNHVVHIYDCKYHENQDGIVTGGILSDEISNGATIKISDCIIKGRLVNSGTIEISGGTMYGGLKNLSSGTVHITGGSIYCGGSLGTNIENSGVLHISGGTIASTTDGNCIDSYGLLNISGGTVLNPSTYFRSTCVNVSGGKLMITGGLIESGRKGITCDEAGEVTINGGTIKSSGTGITNEGKITFIDGMLISTTDSIVNSGQLLISGGTIKSSPPSGTRNYAIDNSGTVLITGGTITGSESDPAIWNDDGGDMSVCAGTISGICNSGAKMTINGGRFITTVGNAVLNQYSGHLIISSGTFQSVYGCGIYNSDDSTLILLIDEGSAIKAASEYGTAFNYRTVLSVQAGTAYTGGVIYFDEMGGIGTALTLTDAEQELMENIGAYYQDYVRLVADTQSGTLGNHGESSWIYHRSSGQITITGSSVSVNEPVYVAVYDQNGKMTSVSVINAPGGNADVGDSFDQVKLFWVEATGAPKCKNGIIDSLQ